MDPSYTAGGAYGYTTFTQAQPGGMAVMPETALGVSGNIPGAVLGKLPLGLSNPLIFVLFLALVWSGYVYGAFDIGFKKLGRGSVKVGR